MGDVKETGSTDPQTKKLSAESQIVNFTNMKQCFLLSEAKTLGDLSVKSVNPNGFLYTLCLSDNDVGTLLSKINKPAPSIKNLLNISPLDYSRFVPKIELYKVLYTGERTYVGEAPIPFSTDSSQTLESILNSSSGRGDDVGIVDFSLNFENQSPWGSGRMVNGSLKLIFQNGESLTKDRVLRLSSKGGGTTPFRFSDLISRRGQSPREFAGAHYRIRADVGYAIPPNQTETLNDNLIEQIQSMNLSLILELIDYDLSFEQNGALTLDISYRSYIEAQLDRATYDIFSITKNPYAAAIKMVEAETQEFRKKRKELEKGISKLEEQVEKEKSSLSKKIQNAKTGKGKREIRAAFYEKQRNLSKDKKELEKLNTSDLEAKNDQKIERYKGRNKIEKYSRILTYLYDNDKVKKVTVPKDDLLYFSPEYPDQVKQDVVDSGIFDALPGFFGNKDKLVQDATNDSVLAARKKIRDKNLLKATNGGTAVKGSTNLITRDIARGINNAVLKNDGKPISQEELTKIQGAVFTDISLQLGLKDENKPKSDSDTLDIYWFYYGDLLQAVIDTAELSEKINQDHVGYMFGGIQIPGADTNNSEISILDMPISLEMYLQFFKKMYIDKGVERHSLNNFIKESLQQLLLPSINQMCFGESVSRPVTIKTTTLELGSYGSEQSPIEPFPSNGEAFVKRIYTNGSSGQKLKRLSSGDVLRKCSTNQRYYYNLVYVAENGLPTSLNGDPIADHEKGIYHFYIGADRGLAKEVKFSKAKKNFQAEAMAQKAVADNDEFAEIFNLFNVDLEMIGNTLLKPGVYIYINPTLTGLGQETSRAVGLGGYYLVLEVSNTINKDGWSTSIQADSVSRVSDPVQNIYSPEGSAASKQTEKLETP